MYIVTGGYDTRVNPFKYFTSTELYKDDKWTVLTPKLPTTLTGATLETINNEVLLFGKYYTIIPHRNLLILTLS